MMTRKQVKRWQKKINRRKAYERKRNIRNNNIGKDMPQERRGEIYRFMRPRKD